VCPKAVLPQRGGHAPAESFKYLLLKRNPDWSVRNPGLVRLLHSTLYTA
jgi:hypothetical protein